ncbi:MAG: hypothetical protein KAK01_04100 [Candidatus Marinimicrobia bacterium]|nr:hypothetical protein [Candidatus Neomarinimicrobiota bacterium]
MTPLEPWQKVFIELRSKQKSYADIDPVHALVGCVNCHGGTEPADFEQAHDSTLVHDPSANPEQNCNPCHSQIVETNKNSMHTMAWGERTAIAQRELGAGNNHTNFDECPAALTDGFDSECTSCHTTCGQCHVSRPNSVHGGFIRNHKFNRIPDQTNNCTACHGSRIYVDYSGDLTGNNPDTHYLKGYKCWDCHKEDFHADASDVESRYHLPDLPTCEDAGCHASDLATTNTYHVMHWPDNPTRGLSCYVCHSQPYYNCNSCHSGGEWKEGYGSIGNDINAGGGDYLEYPDFRIGYNYDQDLHDGKWIVVRHIPVSVDSYEPWGHATLANYDDRPTWEYTSPHNIRRFTAQTDTTGGASCNENCHLIGTKAELNGKRFLWQSFIDSAYTEEVEANLPVIVDDHLPSGWPQY